MPLVPLLPLSARSTLFDEGWPLFLLALRIGAVVLLYLFLFSAFRTLRAELRAPVAARERPAAEPAFEDAPAHRPVALPSYVDYSAAEAAWEPPPPPPPVSRRIPLNVAIPSAAAVALVVLGGVALFAGQDPPADTATTPPASTTEAFAPPAVPPAAGRVTVGLAAPEAAQVRVTVDGTVQFDGTLRAGQTQEWEGAERIQVWTDSGKTLLLAVNGMDLGPYSPAMGHADWNRIDFGFWPGWAQ